MGIRYVVKMFHERSEQLTPPEYIPRVPIVERAHIRGKNGHAGQLRADGGDYFKKHCEEMSEFVEREWGITQEMDPEFHAELLMHDLIEDTDVTYEMLLEEFGPGVANVIEGVSKFKSNEGKTKTLETRRKVLLQGYEDPRTLLVKIADRLHNMRTLGNMSEEGQKRKSIETLEIYAPVARALGMWKVKTELEDLSFQYLYPEEFLEFRAIVDDDPRRSEEFIAHSKTFLEERLRSANIEARIEDRKNGYWALFQKSERYARLAQGGLNQINDIVSFRVVCQDAADCYRALGIVHSAPLPECTVDISRFDEFIAEPRPNNYRAIQTTLNWRPKDLTSDSLAVEIALASREMEAFNNDGIVSKIRQGETNLDEYLMKSVFVQNGSPDRVKLRLLLKNATGVDLAYQVLGHTTAARAEALETPEGERVPLTAIFPNAALYNIILSDTRRSPKKAWLPYVLPETAQVIHQQIAEDNREQAIKTRSQMLDHVLNKRGVLSLDDLPKRATHLLSDYDCSTITELAFLVTRSTDAMARFESSLDQLGITKEKLGWTSIELKGMNDSHGILRDVVEWFREIGRTIIKDESRVFEDGSFTISMIIKDMSEEEQQKVRDLLAIDTRFTSVKLV